MHSAFRLVVVSLGCAMMSHTLQAQVLADKDAIRTARIAQNAAMAAGDVERAATFWTNDVTIRRGLGANVDGLDAYKAILERAPIPATALVYERVTTDVNVSPQWPLAFETGTWHARVGGKGPDVITGRYSAQWVKRDGRWLIRSEVFVALACARIGCSQRAAP